MDQIPATRRRHSAELKARVLAACAEPGASVSRIAMENGLNANLVFKWRRRAGRGQRSAKNLVPATEFVPLPILPNAPARPGRHSDLDPSRWDHAQHRVADLGCSVVRPVAAGAPWMIRIDAIWLAVEPLDMRAGTETALARVIKVSTRVCRRRACWPRCWWPSIWIISRSIDRKASSAERVWRSRVRPWLNGSDSAAFSCSRWWMRCGA